MLTSTVLLLSLNLTSPGVTNSSLAHAAPSTNHTDIQPNFLFQGLQPEFYLRMRRPEPNIDRELDKGLPYVTHFMGLYNNLEAYPFASNAEYPQHLSAKTIAHLQVQERIALQSGIIRLVAQSQHAAAFSFLRDIISNDDEKMALRSTATRALGFIVSEHSQIYLENILNNKNQDLRLRSAAVRALAYFKKPEILAQFKTLLWADIEPELIRALIPALAQLGAKNPLEPLASHEKEAGAILARFLVSTHPNTKNIPISLITQALGRVPHPSTIEFLQNALKSNRTLAQNKRIRRALRHMELAQSRAPKS